MKFRTIDSCSLNIESPLPVFPNTRHYCSSAVPIVRRTFRPCRRSIASMKNKRQLSLLLVTTGGRQLAPGLLENSYAIRCENVSGRLHNDQFCWVKTYAVPSVVVNTLNLTWHNGVLFRTDSRLDRGLQRAQCRGPSVKQEDHTRYRISVDRAPCYERINSV